MHIQQLMNELPKSLIFSSGRPPAGSYIKALVVYNKPEHYREIVERCVNHITKQNDGEYVRYGNFLVPLTPLFSV